MKYYAVRIGRLVGIFFTWEECKAQIHKYPKAEYKSFDRVDLAVEYIAFESKKRLS
jgi:ribonuclease HI